MKSCFDKFICNKLNVIVILCFENDTKEAAVDIGRLTRSLVVDGYNVRAELCNYT